MKNCFKDWSQSEYLPVTVAFQALALNLIQWANQISNIRHMELFLAFSVLIKMTCLAWSLHSHYLTRLLGSVIYIQVTSSVSSSDILDLSQFYHFFKKQMDIFIRVSFCFFNQAMGTHQAQTCLNFNC